MSHTRVIRYTTTPETADENERLIREVFAELAVEQPEGVHYESIRLDGGHDFIHIVTLDGPDNPLFALPAFAAFQAGIGARCSAGPAAGDATIVGSYSPSGVAR
jgi:hypothetical protein